MTESMYKSITGMYSPPDAKNEEKPINKDPDKWSEQANDYFKGHKVPKRVIDTDGSQEVYNKGFVTFLIIFSILSVIAFLVIAGVFVYKYNPTKIDQPISVNPNVTVQGDTVNVDATDEINPEFYNDNQATIVIEKVEVSCFDGGCTGEGSGGNESV